MWFSKLETTVHPLLDVNRQSGKRRVKIAILDSSVDSSEISDPEIAKLASWEQLKGTRSFTDDQKSDNERFLTSSTAAVLLKVSPHAELYVAHVSSKKTDVNVEAITDVSFQSFTGVSMNSYKFCRQLSGRQQFGKLTSLS